MKKLILYNLILLSFNACNSGSTQNSNTGICPTSAPLFSSEIGNDLINQWGKNAFSYSPYGNLGYTDPYIGAAYFTGIEYTSNATLLPTLSPTTRTGSQEIYDYFTHFLAHGPVMTNNPGTPESGGPFISLAECGNGVISGYYSFTFKDGSESANARYTFQFEYQPPEPSIQIIVESGPDYGNIITNDQPVGWYIKLQNSALLPSTNGISENLLIQ